MRTRFNLSYKELAKRIGEEAILRKYIPNYTRPYVNFRLRDVKSDRKASCRVTVSNGIYFIRDFGDDDYRNGAKSLYNFLLDEFKTDEDSLCRMIYLDFKDNIDRGIIVESDHKDVVTDSIIKVRYREWRSHDIKFWARFNLTIADVEAADIKPISHFWITSNNCNNEMFYAHEYSYSYNYYWKDGIFRRKIYQPYSSLKWLSNSDRSVVQNYKNLKKEGHSLIVQTSLKDSLVTTKLDRLSVAPIAESTWFTEEYWGKISQRYTDIVYFANNDWNKPRNEGLIYAEKIKSLYDIPYVYIPTEYECTDISEFSEKYGLHKTNGLLYMLNV